MRLRDRIRVVRARRVQADFRLPRVTVTRGSTTPDGGDLNTGQIHFCPLPTVNSGTLDFVQMRFSSAGTGEVIVAYIEEATQDIVLEAQYAVTVSSGVASYAINQAIGAGRYIGYRRITGTNVRWATGFRKPWANAAAFIANGRLAYSVNTALPAIAYTATEVVSPLLPELAIGAGRNAMIGYGQSLIIGADSAPIISTTPSAKHLTFGTGPKMTQPSFGSVASSDDGTEKALVEDNVVPDSAGTNGETLSTGFVEQYDALHGSASPVWFASVAGKGGTAINLLDPFSATYQNFIHHVKAGKARADAAGQPYRLSAIPMVHGQSDQLDGTSKADYKHYLGTLLDRARWEVKQITGQTSPPRWLFTSATAGILVSSGATDAVLELCDERDDCFYVIPDYRLPHINTLHLTAAGEKLLGAYMARAAYQLQRGQAPGRMRWMSATASGTAFTAIVRGPTAAAFNTSIIGAAADQGIKIVDDTGTLTLSSLSVGTAVENVPGFWDTPITCTLSRVLGANPKFRYARDVLGSGVVIASGASGNVFDTTPDTVTINATVYSLAHPAPPVELAIT